MLITVSKLMHKSVVQVKKSGKLGLKTIFAEMVMDQDQVQCATIICLFIIIGLKFVKLVFLGNDLHR